jgi:hypothetical protein
MTGSDISLARPFRFRLISEISCSRESFLEPERMSWR